MQFFSHDLGIDLGTSNVLIYVDGSGVLIREPSVVAVDKNSGRILQVGAAARNMLGRTPGNVVAMHPLKDGVISDHEMTVKMLQHLFRVSSKSKFFTPKPRVVICGPSGVTEVEERTVINAAIEATKNFGTGCSGSRFLNGTTTAHVELEKELAEFLQKEDCVTMSTGFQTNL